MSCHTIHFIQVSFKESRRIPWAETQAVGHSLA